MNSELKLEFKKLIDALPGSNERIQISSLLEVATEFKVSNETTSYLSKILNEKAFQIEHNLDFIRLPYPTVWIEWSETVRREEISYNDDQSIPQRIGVLLCEHPEFSSVVLGVICWETKTGKIDHSHALISWDNNAITNLSRDARNSFSKVNSEVIQRLLSTVNTYIPDGFVEEIDILSENEPSYISVEEQNFNARLDASIEVPFVYSILLLLNSNNSKLEKLDSNILSRFEIGHFTNKKRKLSFDKSGFNRVKTKKFIELQLKD